MTPTRGLSQHAQTRLAPTPTSNSFALGLVSNAEASTGSRVTSMEHRIVVFARSSQNLLATLSAAQFCSDEIPTGKSHPVVLNLPWRLFSFMLMSVEAAIYAESCASSGENKHTASSLCGLRGAAGGLQAVSLRGRGAGGGLHCTDTAAELFNARDTSVRQTPPNRQQPPTNPAL